jgi:hypothetical protein
MSASGDCAPADSTGDGRAEPAGSLDEFTAIELAKSLSHALKHLSFEPITMLERRMESSAMSASILKG